MLAHFAVIKKIGEGGMGVVYKARDTRLDRLVALKLLHDYDLADADRKARFTSEAKAASALNHPNIVTVHDIAEADGQTFIVMEFVDGAPLSELIPQRGMKAPEVLRLAAQIADALSVAHAAGIVHRDLKPGNIMVDIRGRVKVLDFGLAKLMTSSSVAPSAELETVTMGKPLTEQGVIIGSIPYMSPEQAEGRPVDARSDIFSFGAVLYEMATGQPAFSGRSRASTLAAVLERDPKPPASLVPAIPTELDRLISRCLRKDPEKRSQHMSDVRVSLEELRDEVQPGDQIRSASKALGIRVHALKWRWLGVAIGIVALAGAAGWMYRHNPVKSGSGAPELTRLSPDDGYSYFAPAISPDGKLVAYVSDRSGKQELWLQQVGGRDAIQLTHSLNDVGRPFFFPDGTKILYFTSSPAADETRHDTLEVIPTLGGQPQVLATGFLPFNRSYGSVSVSPDGRQVAYLMREPSRIPRLMIIPTAGGGPRTLGAWNEIQPRGGFTPSVTWTADGRYLLCVGSKRPEAGLSEWEWFALSTDGGKPIPTGAGDILRSAGFGISAPSAVIGDRVLFSGPSLPGGHVWEITLAPGNWRAEGPPRQLTFGTEQETATSISIAGTAAIQTSKQYSDLYLLPLDAATGQSSGVIRRLTHDSRLKIVPFSFSASGDPAIGYFLDYSATHGGVFAGYTLDLKTARQNPLVPEVAFTAAWTISRDGRQIAYSIPEGDSYTVRVGEAGKSIDSARVLCRGCGRVSAFSPDGRFLIYDAGRRPQPDPSKKFTIRFFEVGSGAEKPWLDHPTDSLELDGMTGDRGEWAVISARPPGAPPASARTYLVPWREEPVPQAEWIDVPATNAKFSLSGNVIYSFKGAALQAMKFDPKTKRIGQPFQAIREPNSQQVLRPDDVWEIRDPGIVFTRSDSKSSVWLMKMPE